MNPGDVIEITFYARRHGGYWRAYMWKADGAFWTMRPQFVNLDWLRQAPREKGEWWLVRPIHTRHTLMIGVGEKRKLPYEWKPEVLPTTEDALLSLGSYEHIVDVAEAFMGIMEGE